MNRGSTRTTVIATLLAALWLVVPTGTATAGPGDDDGVSWYTGRSDSFYAAFGTDWHAVDPGTHVGISGGSGPGYPGPLEVVSKAPTTPRAASGRTWQVDSSAAYGGGIEVTGLLLGDRHVPYLRIELVGLDGEVLTADVDNPNPVELESYIDYDVRILPGPWVDGEGDPATEAQIRDVLADFRQIRIGMPFLADQPDGKRSTMWLHDIWMAGPPGTDFPEPAWSTYPPTKYHGHLSGTPTCTDGREVTINRVSPSRKLRPVLRETVDEDGGFRLHPRRLGPGHYVATVPALTRDGVSCVAGVSRAVRVR